MRCNEGQNGVERCFSSSSANRFISWFKMRCPRCMFGGSYRGSHCILRGIGLILREYSLGKGITEVDNCHWFECS